MAHHGCRTRCNSLLILNNFVGGGGEITGSLFVLGQQ